MMLIGVYLVLAFMAVLVVIIFVPNISATDDTRNKEGGAKTSNKFSLKLCVQTLKQLTNKLQLFMVPLNLYIGMEEGFTMVEYTMVRVVDNRESHILGVGGRL